jgi:dihydroflavonol-4-reductase
MVAVVTGAGGHIGTNLVRALLEQGRDVVAVDLHESPALVRLGARWISADVRDEEALRRAYAGAHVVFHLAAVISVAGDRHGLVPSVNIGGVAASARAALYCGVDRFVHCSSVHAFDLEVMHDRVVDEDSPRATRPDLPAYDRSKAAGERALRTVVDRGLNAVILNPSGIVGPRDETPSRMGAVLLAAARGRLPATVQGSFDWVDVRDVVHAMLAAERHGEAGANYLLGGHSADIATLAAWAADAAGARHPYADLPLWFARAWSPAATAVGHLTHDPLLYTRDSLHAVASRPCIDHSRAGTVLGHHARALEESVVDLIRYYADEGRLTLASAA